MVRNEVPSIYFFLGQDIIGPDGSSRKGSVLHNIKSNFLTPKNEIFNFDTLYAKDIDKKGLQRVLLQLPVNSRKRIVLIKDPQYLNSESRDFLLTQIKKGPESSNVFVLDINEPDIKDIFVNAFSRNARVFHFRDPGKPSTFRLARQIELCKTVYALGMLRQLLNNGEKPERILGGLRYALEKETSGFRQRKKRINLLLRCDLDIKTGRLKSVYALECLVVKLCVL